MTEELLQEFKKELELEKNEIKLNKKRLVEAKELEKNECVKIYLKLCNLDSATRFIYVGNEDNIEMRTFNSIVNRIDSDETNGIYIYCGTYRYDDKGMTKVKAGSSDAEYRKYWDIEQPGPTFIPIEECEAFEKNNTVVVANIESVRKTFIDETLNSNQEKAKMLVKTKFKSNIK